MKTIITWNAGFGYPVTPEMEADFTLHGKSVSVSAEFDLDLPADPTAALEAIFEQTNLYGGPLWETIKDHLPASRTHTALSVGDEIAFGGRCWRCSRFGWTETP